MVEEEQELSNVEWGENRFPSSFPFHRRLDNIKQHNTTSEWKYIPKYIWYAYINTLYTQQLFKCENIALVQILIIIRQTLLMCICIFILLVSLIFMFPKNNLKK